MSLHRLCCCGGGGGLDECPSSCSGCVSSFSYSRSGFSVNLGGGDPSGDCDDCGSASGTEILTWGGLCIYVGSSQEFCSSSSGSQYSCYFASLLQCGGTPSEVWWDVRIGFGRYSGGQLVRGVSVGYKLSATEVCPQTGTYTRYDVSTVGSVSSYSTPSTIVLS
jgi:hypothetical protein